MRWIERNDNILAVATFLAKRLREFMQIEPVAEEMIEHCHAVRVVILHNNDGHAVR